MAETPPIIYLLHGDDEFAIAGFIAELERKIGESGAADMNILHLDGRTCTLEQWFQPAMALPFLARRRLVVLWNPLECAGKKEEAQQKFIEHLKQVPPSTALVLAQNGPLTGDEERRKKRLNWLEQWATTAGPTVYLRQFTLPRGRELMERLQKRARELGGELTSEAAETLVSLVGEHPRQAEQELHKLLAYVNYARPVQAEDVMQVTADTAEGDVFKLVDAMAERRTSLALGMLRRLLEQSDAIALQGMVVRQFRLLLLTRCLLEQGADRFRVSSELRIPGFVADKLLGQARRFSSPFLENCLRQLLDLDQAAKTGKVPLDLALETFVVSFTTGQPLN